MIKVEQMIVRVATNGKNGAFTLNTRYLSLIIIEVPIIKVAFSLDSWSSWTDLGHLGVAFLYVVLSVFGETVGCFDRFSLSMYWYWLSEA